MDTNYSTINIYHQLKQKYKEYLKPEITAVSIMQSKETVWLEIIESIVTDDGFEKQTIQRTDLAFIVDDIDTDACYSYDCDYEKKLYFNTSEPIENNAKKFVNEFDLYSIINTTDLFNDSACEKIDTKSKWDEIITFDN